MLTQQSLGIDRLMELLIKTFKENEDVEYLKTLNAALDEQVEKNCVIGATEICVLSEWIKLVNNEVKTHCEVCYGLKKS